MADLAFSKSLPPSNASRKGAYRHAGARFTPHVLAAERVHNDALTKARFAFEHCFPPTLDRLGAKFTAHPVLRPAWSQTRTYLENRGKCVRPTLFLASYCLFQKAEGKFEAARSGTDGLPPIPSSLATVACGMEIFHAFALIHDDIADAAISRRGQLPLHLRPLFGLEDGAEPLDTHALESLATVIGDVLFGFAMELFLAPDLPPASATRALRYFLGVAQDTGLGQAVELAHRECDITSISEKEIENTYLLKTSRYTVESPLYLGAAFSGADDSVLNLVQEVATPLGLAFQIYNDLHEIDQPDSSTDGFAYDLQSATKTLPLVRLATRLSPEESRQLSELLVPGAVAPKDLEWVRQKLVEHNIAQELKNDVTVLFSQSQRRLESARISAPLKGALRQLLAFFAAKCHHSEAKIAC